MDKPNGCGVNDVDNDWDKDAREATRARMKELHDKLMTSLEEKAPHIVQAPWSPDDSYQALSRIARPIVDLERSPMEDRSQGLAPDAAGEDVKSPTVLFVSPSNASVQGLEEASRIQEAVEGGVPNSRVFIIGAENSLYSMSFSMHDGFLERVTKALDEKGIVLPSTADAKPLRGMTDKSFIIDPCPYATVRESAAPMGKKTRSGNNRKHADLNMRKLKLKMRKASQRANRGKK